MLVIARKRHEAVTIDGNIRVEVLRLSGGMARLRFVAPKRITIQRGVARPGVPPAAEAVNGGIDAAGMGVVDLTLADQQIITVRSDIHLGLVDVDTTRAVLFVDAPDGTSVNVESTVSAPAGRPRSAAGDKPAQALLPFAPTADSDLRDSRKFSTESPQQDPAAPTIPFPGNGSGQECGE